MLKFLTSSEGPFQLSFTNKPRCSIAESTLGAPGGRVSIRKRLPPVMYEPAFPDRSVDEKLKEHTSFRLAWLKMMYPFHHAPEPVTGTETLFPLQAYDKEGTGLTGSEVATVTSVVPTESGEDLLKLIIAVGGALTSIETT